MKINKLIKYSFKYALLISVFTSVVFLDSCEKESTGAPIITNVRETDPATAGMNLESVTLGSYLVIQGSNLATTRNVFFNGLEAYVYATYVTDNNIVVQVPDTTPTIATDPDNATNVLHVVTDNGEIFYNLTILPPPAIIDSISNEFALPGEKITLYGNYYYFVNSIQFPDSVIVTSGITAAANGKSCTVTVPDGVGSGHIRVYSESGVSNEVLASNFRDTASLTGEFEHPGFSVAGNAEIKNGENNPVIPSIRGNYIYFFGVEISTASYFTQSISLETHYMNYQEMFTYPGASLIPDDYSTAKLALEFEIFVFEPWVSGFFEVAFLKPDPNDGTVDAWTNAYRTYFDNKKVSSDSKGKWVTKRILINEFSINAEGVTVPLEYSQIKDMPINMNFKNPSVEAGGSFIPLLMLGMDNLRIVMIN